jgi:hypothetical protein
MDGSAVNGNDTNTPVPVTWEPTDILVLSIVVGSVTPAGNVMAIVPDPGARAEVLVPETANVTDQDPFPFTLELDGANFTLCTPFTGLWSARASLAENMPKANIVAIAAMAMSSASPKDCPILVFIYSYLLVLLA